MSDAELLKKMITGQFEAALGMLRDCIEACPDEQWDGLVAKYPFWQVAYHTLCYADLYLSPSNDGYTPRPELHPKGIAEFEDEYPSRRFDRAELQAYLRICFGKLEEIMARETAESLGGSSGFSWLKFPRAEAHLYNIRHIQHHAGQLGVFVRRCSSVDLNWISTGRSRR